MTLFHHGSVLFVAGIQQFLRSGCDMMMHSSSVIKASFLYGRGGGLLEEGVFCDYDPIHGECLRFCFMSCLPDKHLLDFTRLQETSFKTILDSPGAPNGSFQ